MPGWLIGGSEFLFPDETCSEMRIEVLTVGKMVVFVPCVVTLPRVTGGYSFSECLSHTTLKIK
jgi:hypothetical protein